MNKDFNNPLVSVCIPAYNSERYIKDTIKSVMTQSYRNIEIIIVDDCSKDNTISVIQKCKDFFEKIVRSDKTIQFYQNKKNLGMAGNWNRCLALCKGKYIKLLCADDLLAKDSIKKEVSILERNSEVICVSSDTQFIDVNGRKSGIYRRYYRNGVIDGKQAVLFSLFTRDYLGAPLANLFRQDIFLRIGNFDDQFRYILDYDFFSRIYLQGKVFIIHEPLNFFRIRTDSNTGEVLGGGKGAEYVLEHEKLLRKLKEPLKLTRWQISVSSAIRRLMNIVGGIYLKLHLAN